MRAAIVTLVAVTSCHDDDEPPRTKPMPHFPTTYLVLRVTDGGKPVAARVVLIDSKNQPLHMGNLDVYGRRQGAAACALAPGVIASYDGLILGYGLAEVPVGADTCRPSPAIPYGRYKLKVWRGVEYEEWEGSVDLSAGRGRVEVAIPLERAWTAHGTLAADLHVHAAASNDSTMPNPQRVVAQVAAGISVIGLSDHNMNGDLDAEIHELHLDDVVASIASNELTANELHLGVYPVVVDRKAPRNGSPPDEIVRTATIAGVFELARRFPNHPIVQVNHPRFRVTALFDSAGWDGIEWPPPFPLAFDAIEVISGFSAYNGEDDRRLDETVRDFYTMTDHGKLVAPLGNSDTHDLNWVLDGTARNYVYVDDTRTRPFDEDGFVAAIRGRRVVATTGPWLDVEVASKEGATPTAGPGQAIAADRGSVWVALRVERARFAKVERVRITVGTQKGPKLVKVINVPDQRAFSWSGSIEVGGRDTWLGVTADGDTALPLEITGSYQKEKWNHAGVTPYAIASPILIDANRDGKWKRGATNIALPKR